MILKYCACKHLAVSHVSHRTGTLFFTSLFSFFYKLCNKLSPQVNQGMNVKWSKRSRTIRFTRENKGCSIVTVVETHSARIKSSWSNDYLAGWLKKRRRKTINPLLSLHTEVFWGLDYGSSLELHEQDSVQAARLCVPTLRREIWSLFIDCLRAQCVDSPLRQGRVPELLLWWEPRRNSSCEPLPTAVVCNLNIMKGTTAKPLQFLPTKEPLQSLSLKAITAEGFRAKVTALLTERKCLLQRSNGETCRERMEQVKPEIITVFFFLWNPPVLGVV